MNHSNIAIKFTKVGRDVLRAVAATTVLGGVALCVTTTPAGATVRSHFGSGNAAWSAYYAAPSNRSTWAAFCAGGGGVIAAYANGVPACGHTGGTSIYMPPAGDSLWTPGFQCTEVVGRYEWVKYGLHPVKGNGAQDAETYASDYHRSLIRNGTGRSPQVGDVMSFSNVSNFSDTGHTSVVVATSVNSSGNGSIKTLNEDWGYPIGDGTGALLTLAVSKWSVNESEAGGFPYIEWAATGGPTQSLQITTPSTPTSPPNASVNKAYSFQLSATGGKNGYVWSLAGGSLPPGLTLNAAGLISGKSTVVSEPNGFTAEVKSNGEVAEAQFVIWSLKFANTLAITTPSTAASPPNATVGVAYSFKFSSTGGSGSYVWSKVGGSLPPGLSVLSSGTVAGTPSSVSEGGPFTVKVTSGGQTAEKSFTIWALPRAVLTITTPSTASSPPNATVGKAYSFSFHASGANGQYVWSLVSGDLPPGLKISSSGTISGTPTAVSKDGPFTLEVGSGGQTARKAFTIWSLS